MYAIADMSGKVARPPQPTLSKRSQRQNVVKEIIDQFIDGASENEILENLDEGNVQYAKRLLRNLDMENSRVNSCSGIQLDAHYLSQYQGMQKIRQPTIDKFLRKNVPRPPTYQKEESQDELLNRLAILKSENRQLQAYADKNFSQAIARNLIALVLRKQEACREQIIARYNGSKNYAMIRQVVDNKTHQTCQEFLLNESRIRDFARQLDQLNANIQQTQNYSVQSAYKSLRIQLQQYLKEARLQANVILENIQYNYILLQQYKYLTQMNSYRSYELPTLYPPDNTQYAAMSSKNTSFLYSGQPYLLLQLIGRGGFSSVYKAFNIRNSKFVALKLTQVEVSEGTQINQKQKLARREAQIHQALDHCNILKVFNADVFSYTDSAQKMIEERYIEMELCDGLTLFQHICVKRYLVENKGKFSYNEALSIILQIASALSYLHDDIGVVHNDISLSNIIMSQSVWKVSDFTLAKRGNQTQADVTTLGCTLPYVAPEVENARKFSTQSDIFSFGVCIFGLLTGGIDIFQQRGKGSQPDLQKAAETQLQQCKTALYDADEELLQMQVRMLDFDAERRPTAREVYEFCQRKLDSANTKKLK